MDRYLVDRWLMDKYLVDRWLMDRCLVDMWLVDRRLGEGFQDPALFSRCRNMHIAHITLDYS